MITLGSERVKNMFNIWIFANGSVDQPSTGPVFNWYVVTAPCLRSTSVRLLKIVGSSVSGSLTIPPAGKKATEDVRPNFC